MSIVAWVFQEKIHISYRKNTDGLAATLYTSTQIWGGKKWIFCRQLAKLPSQCSDRLSTSVVHLHSRQTFFAMPPDHMNRWIKSLQYLNPHVTCGLDFATDESRTQTRLGDPSDPWHHLNAQPVREFACAAGDESAPRGARAFLGLR